MVLQNNLQDKYHVGAVGEIAKSKRGSRYELLWEEKLVKAVFLFGRAGSVAAKFRELNLVLTLAQPHLQLQ